MKFEETINNQHGKKEKERKRLFTVTTKQIQRKIKATHTQLKRKKIKQKDK